MNAPQAFNVKPYLDKKIEKKVIIRVVVDEQYAELLRRTVISTFGNCIDFIKVQPLAHTHSVKMWFDVTLSVVERVMNTIHACFTSCRIWSVYYATNLYNQ